MERIRDLFIKGLWYKFDYPFAEADAAVKPFLDAPSECGWLKRARTALFLSAESVAKKMGVSQWNYSRFEANEERMSLKNLRRCAEAMDCEVIYAIRPKERTVYSERIWKQLQDGGPPDLHWLRTYQYFPGYRKLHGWRKNFRAVDPGSRQHYWSWRTGDQGVRQPLPRRKRR